MILLAFDLEKFWADLALQLIPGLLRFTGALILLFVGRYAAKLITRIISRLLAKTGIDKLADPLNEIDIVHRSKIQIRPSYIVGKLIYYLIMFIFIMISVEIMGIAALSNLMQSALEYLPNLLTAFVVLLAGILLSDTLRKAVDTTLTSLGIPSGKLISNIVFYFLFINVAMVALSQAKVDTAFMQDNLKIVLAGIVLAFALAYGYASRGTVGNFVATFQQKARFIPGDVISLGNIKGEVKEVNQTHLIMLTSEGLTMVPMHKLLSEQVVIHKQTERMEEPK